MFLYKHLFFSTSSILSIPIMLIGINGGYFPAMCRVCYPISIQFPSPCRLLSSLYSTLFFLVANVRLMHGTKQNYVTMACDRWMVFLACWFFFELIYLSSLLRLSWTYVLFGPSVGEILLCFCWAFCNLLSFPNSFFKSSVFLTWSNVSLVETMVCDRSMVFLALVFLQSPTLKSICVRAF